MNRALRFELCALVLALAGCAMPAADPRTVGMVPDREAFAPVAQALERHCGSLDCHGSDYRNLRLYGSEGLRLAESDRPYDPTCTTADEIEQDYQAVVGLEPEAMNAVVADGGGQPERLSLVRKARGLEHHKGGSAIHAGDDADDCLTSWLRGATDDAACARAVPQNDCP